MEGHNQAQTGIKPIWSFRKQINIKSLFDENNLALDKMTLLPREDAQIQFSPYFFSS